MAAEWLLWVTPILGALVAFAAALTVFATAAGRAPNRRLALVFVLEGFALTLGSVSKFVPYHDPMLYAARTIQLTYFILPLAYLNFLATLPSRLVAPLRPRPVRFALLALALFWVALYLARPYWFVADIVPGPLGDWTWVTGGQPEFMFILYPLQVLVPVFGFAVALASFFAATRGTPSRKRAVFYAAAFGTRDALFVIVLGGGMFVGDDSPVARYLYSVGLPLATLIPVVLLTYGILRTQLFDIDLKIKVAVQRSTVVTIVAIASIVTGKLVDHYAQAEYGWYAAIGVAIGMLFFVRALEGVGHRVANTALPHVQHTPVYVQFKKLEVYKAAVESAIETGAIDVRQRKILDKLRAKLGLADADARAVEDEVIPGSAAPTGAAPS